MHRKCEESVDTSGAHSKTIRVRVLLKVHVSSYATTTAKFVSTPHFRPAIARRLVQVFRTCMTKATIYCYLTQSWLLPVLYIDCTLLTGARAGDIMHHRLRIPNLPKLQINNYEPVNLNPRKNPTIWPYQSRDSRNSLWHQQTRYIAKQLVPLSPAPVLDCNRRRNYHICTGSYMDRH